MVILLLFEKIVVTKIIAIIDEFVTKKPLLVDNVFFFKIEIQNGFGIRLY